MKSSNRERVSKMKTKEEVKSTMLDSGFESGINASCASSSTADLSSGLNQQQQQQNVKKQQQQVDVDSGLGIDYCSPSSSALSLESLSLVDDEKVGDVRCGSKSGEDGGGQVKDSGLGLGLTSSSSQQENEHEKLQERVQSALKSTETLSRECFNLLNPPIYYAFLNEAFQQDADGDTRLHLSVIERRLDLVFSLIFFTSETYYLDIQNKQNQTALHVAVLTNQPNMVRPLVLAGANLMLRDHQGNTALHLACRYGFLECVKQLTKEVTPLEEKYLAVTSPTHLPPRRPPKIPSAAIFMDTHNNQGCSCVHLAAIFKHTEILLWLKKYGANIDAKEGCGGRTSITFAVESRDTNMVNFLVKECAANMNAENYAGLTAYQIAYQSDRKMAEQLRSLGAQTFYDDDDDQYFDSDDENMDTCLSSATQSNASSPSLPPTPMEDDSKSNFYDLKINGEPLW